VSAIAQNCTGSIANAPATLHMRAERTVSSYAYSAALCLAIVTVLTLTSPELNHWFVLPVLACGTLIGADLIDWARGRLDLFSPVGVLGVVGFHLLFMAPLLHVYWDFWALVPDSPSDWRPWLGLAATLNAVGLLGYCVLTQRARRAALTKSAGRVWSIDWRSFYIVWLAILLLSACAQAYVYISFGGILGYMLASVEPGDAFAGFGAIFAISECFPIVLLTGVVLIARRARFVPSLPLILCGFVVFFALQMVFGGLRGSRSNTIWALFWAAGMVHLCVRPLTRGLAYAGLGFLFAFMVVYSFYKSYGPDAVQVIGDDQARAETARYRGQPLKGVLLTDFGRSDVQAVILYRRLRSAQPLAYGETYLGAATMPLPSSISPWATKAKVGTELLYGRGSYVAGSFRSSRLFGLSGEAMLNFGLAGVPVAFLVLGLFVSGTSRWIEGLHPADARVVLAPFLTVLGFFMLLNDSDNLVFVVIKNLTIPFLFLFAICRVGRASQDSATGSR
jgi:hypothetical protein